MRSIFICASHRAWECQNCFLRHLPSESANSAHQGPQNRQRTHLRTANALTSKLDPLGVKSLHTCKRTEPIFKTFLSNEREGRSKKNSFQPIWLDVGKSNVAQRLLCVYLYLKHRLSTMKKSSNFYWQNSNR